MNFTTRTRILQAAAGTAAAVLLFASWPAAAKAAMKDTEKRIAASGSAALTLEDPETVGALVIPPIREIVGAGRADVQHIDNERRLAEKLARWEKRETDCHGPEALAMTEADYTEQELELLAIVIYSEAGSDTITNETRRMVGEVVLNRVADERYPDTIAEVLTQRGQYGRFFWTGVVWPARADRAAEAHAVERAYACARTVFEDERLLPEDVIYQAAHVQGEIVAQAPGFYFCRG